MLSILLKILTVMGIIALILLGILLLLILMILFIPITYRIRGYITETEREISVKMRWFGGLIRFDLEHKGQLTYKLKLLWFDLSDRFRKNKVSKKQTRQTSDVKTKVKVTSMQETEASDSKLNRDTMESKPVIEEAPASETFESEASKDTFSEKMQKVNVKGKQLRDKIKGMWNTITYYYHLLREEDTTQIASLCFGGLFKVIKSLWPRRLKFQGIIGFDSPDITGKVYGALCMLYPYYGNNIHIEPDFNNKIMQGELECSGRIFLFILGFHGLRILINKKFFKVMNKFKNGGNANGR